MENKAIIEAHINRLGKKIGCYDKALDKLTQKALNELLENILDGDSTDIVIQMRGRLFVVECSSCDDEMDFTVYTKGQYLSEYGDEYEYKFEGY